MNDGNDDHQLPVLYKDREKCRQITSLIVPTLSEEEHKSLLVWSYGLLEIRNNSALTVTQKSKAAIQLTAQQKIVWPVVRSLAAEVKQVTWDERSTKSRLGLTGAVVGAIFFGGQSAGIAALGTAIGVPLWVVIGAGGTFAGVLIEELSARLHQDNRPDV